MTMQHVSVALVRHILYTFL